MKREKLFKQEVVTEDGLFQLEYFLLIRSAKEEYGIEIVKKGKNGQIQKEHLEGLVENRKIAEAFLKKLAEGLALPIELSDLCADFLYEREWEERAESA